MWLCHIDWLDEKICFIQKPADRKAVEQNNTIFLEANSSYLLLGTLKRI